MSKYVNSVLGANESIKFETKLHWVIFIIPILVAVVPIIIAGGNGKVAGVFILIGAILFIAKLVQYITSEFSVTNKRVIIKVGFIRRSTLEINIGKVEGISINQSIIGRILGYGNIIISGSGGTRQLFKNVSQSIKFQQMVNAEIDALTNKSTGN